MVKLSDSVSVGEWVFEWERGRAWVWVFQRSLAHLRLTPAPERSATWLLFFLRVASFEAIAALQHQPLISELIFFRSFHEFRCKLQFAISFIQDSSFVPIFLKNGGGSGFAWFISTFKTKSSNNGRLSTRYQRFLGDIKKATRSVSKLFHGHDTTEL